MKAYHPKKGNYGKRDYEKTLVEELPGLSLNKLTKRKLLNFYYFLKSFFGLYN